MRVLAFLVLTALLAVIFVVQQRVSGAYLAEFSATQADEARHFLRGLVVADRMAAGVPAFGPFIQDYALRYPALGVGPFPPLYYLAEGVWFSVLTPSTPAALLLPALIAALLVAGAGWVAGRAMGPLPGLAVGAVLLAAPALRAATVVIGLDLPLALLCFAAALAYAAFLAHGRWRDALVFTLAAAAAILTKASGFALALLPPLAVLIGGRADLLARGAFWAPAPLVALLVAPWYLGGPALDEASWALPAALDARLAAPALMARGAMIVGGIGSLAAGLALIGVLRAAAHGWRKSEGAALMVAVSALAGALLCLLLLAPTPVEAARLVPLLAPVMVLAAFGAFGLVGRLAPGRPAVRGLTVALLLLIAGLPGLFEVVRKTGDGMDEVAQAILARDLKQPVVLVGADPKGENALIAAMAQHDRRQRSFVLAGSRLPALADAGTPPDLGAILARLDQLAVSFLALDTSKVATTHPATRGLMAVVEAHPDRFELIGTYPKRDGRGAVRLYSVAGQGDTPMDPTEMRRRLGASGS